MVRDIEIAPRIDDHEVIWRYMDFPSFYSLLDTKGLFFRRLDKYTDEYEGTLPNEIQTFLLHYFAEIPIIGSHSKAIEMTNTFMSHLKELNKGTLSNSWVVNAKESYAMWKIYLRGSREGIAIKTTVGKLREVLSNNPEQFTLAKVSYEILSWPVTDYTTLAAWKTTPYSYEHELRALIYHQFTDETIPKEVFPKDPLFEHGNAYQVDIHTLIEEVYISPFADSWFYDVVMSTISKFITAFDSKKIFYSRIKDK